VQHFKLIMEFLDDMSNSNTFNVADLFKYHLHDLLYEDNNSMKSFFEAEEIDVG
jgi:hypothetical protein